MKNLNLNLANGWIEIRNLLKTWNDGSKVVVPLIVIKISEAFSMYHQVSSKNFRVENQTFKGLHPILVNDLDTDQNVLLSLDTTGRILHYYLISDSGHLVKRDSLTRAAHKNIHQEYLDYFYCIVKNIENYISPNTDQKKK